MIGSRAITGIIERADESDTGSLGRALQEKLARDSRERAAASTTLKAEKRIGSHLIHIDRPTLTVSLFAPEGHKLVHGSFATMEELVANVSNFLSKHPKTTITCDEIRF